MSIPLGGGGETIVVNISKKYRLLRRLLRKEDTRSVKTPSESTLNHQKKKTTKKNTLIENMGTKNETFTGGGGKHLPPLPPWVFKLD